MFSCWVIGSGACCGSVILKPMGEKLILRNLIPHLPESKVKGTERNEYSREESYVIFMFLNQITYIYINMRKTKKN